MVPSDQLGIQEQPVLETHVRQLLMLICDIVTQVDLPGSIFSRNFFWPRAVLIRVLTLD